MNSWKIIWESFYKNSTRSAIALEAWRLSTIRLRLLLILSCIAFLTYLILFCFVRSGLILAIMVAYEFLLLWAVDQMKEGIFSKNHNDQSPGMVPPDGEAHRDSRYMVFRSLLKEAGIKKNHIADAFLIAETKLDLEKSHGELPKKLANFALGLLTGLLIAYFKELKKNEALLTGAFLILVGFVLISILQAIPSRMERLKELIYFMRLYQLELANPAEIRARISTIKNVRNRN